MSTNQNKEIKSRMIKKAAALWGIAPKDIENSFDPLVTLLLDACASEIEKIETEIGSSQTRITERLIQLMTPEAIHSAQPAHAIAYSEPVEAVGQVQPENSFLLKKKGTQSKNNSPKRIFFSPTIKTKLIQANITHLICGNQLFEQKGHREKNSLGLLEKTLEPSKLYLGIKAEGNLPFKDVSIYFELQQTLLSDLFYHHLKNMTCTLNGEEVSISQGFANDNLAQSIDVDSIFNATTNITKHIEKKTNQFYQKNFITIRSINFLTEENKAPKTLLSDGDLKKYNDLKGLNWLELEFPRMIDSRILKEVYCSLNTFPVLNRKLNEFSYQLKDFVHIVPIQTNDLFLDLRSVQNVDGKVYYQRQNNVSEGQKGTFTLREDQSGKLDSRSAKQFLRHMIELLKEESGSFSFLGSDFLQGHINKLNQTIFLLEKRAEDLTEKSKETVYLSLKPYKNKEVITVSYWTTDGDFANKIKADHPIQNYQGTEIKQNTSYLMTNTIGGKNNLGTQERLNAYRSALLSRNRIVSKEDVRALCLTFYGDRINDVEVHKGYTTDISEHKGILPCIKIDLLPNKRLKTGTQEWQMLNNSLLSILSEKSTSVFPFEISIK